MKSKIKGMVTCDICGRDFPLIAEETYVARDVERGGVVAVITGEVETAWYDAIDCPHCGCQNVLQERKRPIAPEDAGCGEGDDPESCADCCGGCSACPGGEEVDDGE
jgi:hypothetical protein